MAPPTSMYSMKRTSSFRSMPNRNRSAVSSSLKPRVRTAFSFVPVNPSSASASMPRSTVSRRTLRPNVRKRSARSVSRETVTRWSPATRNAEAWRGSNTALVVRARSDTPGTPASRRTRSGRSCRNSGSPPVRRSLSTPNAQNTRVRRSSSSNVRMEERGSQTYSSSGMQ